MKNLTTKWGLLIALVALLGLTACSNTPVTDNEQDNKSSYVVQLVATADASKAETIKNTFVGEGYSNTKVNTISKNGANIHRVQIGPYATEVAGKNMLAKMKTRYLKNQYVNNAVVKTVYGK